jgi:Transposase and inactivated derivatives
MPYFFAWMSFKKDPSAMIFVSERTIYRREEPSIPIQDFIISVFNLKESQIRSISIKRADNETLNAYIVTIPEEKECPYCGGILNSDGHARPKKIINSVLVQHKMVVHWSPHRFICKECGRTVTERNPFTYPGFSISFATIRQIMLDLKKSNLTYKDIAERNYVSITTVQHYFDSYINVPRARLPENLAIDEVHSSMAKYGSAFLCVLYDNVTRQPVDILPCRSKHELSKYYERFSPEDREKVRFVTMDMWDPYRDTAHKYFKNCEVAADPFHVIEHLIGDFGTLRLQIQGQVEYGSPSYYLLKNWNWLLTASNVDLDNKPVMNRVFNRYMNHRDLLEMTLATSDELTSAYYLMKKYQYFNESCPEEEAAQQLDSLIEEFASSDISVYREFVILLNNWRTEIINSFHTPNGRRQSNALAESVNSQIKTYLAVSKGNSNFERFRRRILYCLNDSVFYSCTSFLKTLKEERRKRGAYKKHSSD